MTAVMAREAFGAEFVGAEGFLNTPTYGLPPRFLVDALQDCSTQAGRPERWTRRRSTNRCARAAPDTPR